MVAALPDLPLFAKGVACETRNYPLFRIALTYFSLMHPSMLCAYQCYAPLPPVRAIVGQGGDLINLHINCPNIRDIPYNQIPLRRVGDYWGFDTRSVTVQYTKIIAAFKMSSDVIKCLTIGAASFGQSPYIARYLPVRGVVGHNIDR